MQILLLYDLQCTQEMSYKVMFEEQSNDKILEQNDHISAAPRIGTNVNWQISLAYIPNAACSYSGRTQILLKNLVFPFSFLFCHL